jgi:hypothetical protein
MRLVVQGRADLGSGDVVACPGEHALMAVAGCQGEPRLGASLQVARGLLACGASDPARCGPKACGGGCAAGLALARGVGGRGHARPGRGREKEEGKKKRKEEKKKEKKEEKKRKSEIGREKK